MPRIDAVVWQPSRRVCGAVSLAAAVSLLAACVPYKPTLKLEHTFQTIPAAVQVRPFYDASPPEDRKDASAWSRAQTSARVMDGDLGALVTKALIADFSATAVFRSIHRNQRSPDLILSGTVRRFYGEVSLPSWLRLPGMSWMAHAYWVPFQEWEGEVDLEVTLATADGRIIGTYRGHADYVEVATREGVYWSMPLYPAHVRLNRAFTEAVEQIRDHMFRDRALLLAGIGK